MRKIESKLFGEVVAPKNFTELFEFARDPQLCGGEAPVYMWRGQADINWPLHSAAYRKLKLARKSKKARRITDTSIVRYEKDLLSRATHRGYRFSDARMLSDIELLARLQHHGAATRLLDATRSVLVALYFAVAEHAAKTGLLFGWHTHHLGGDEGQGLGQEYFDCLESLKGLEHPQTWEPPEVSKRIAAQQSQFVFSSVMHKTTGSVAIDPTPGSHLAIAITPEVKNEFGNILLETFDIRRVTMFPDLDGFGIANSVEAPSFERYRW